MSSEYRGPYIIRDRSSAGDAADEAEAWVTPEPAELVIVEEVLAATDLPRAAIEPLEEHVNFEALEMVLEGDDEGVLTFDVDGHEITVAHDGSVEVAGPD
jgi:hypothetical protein